MNPTPRSQLGASGEAHARAFLESRGYVFIAANWRCAAGELDLVMHHASELVFVEVKTRRGEQAGRAEDAISPAKARRLLASGEWFVASHPEWQDAIWRVDLVAITLGAHGEVIRATHVENAIVSG
ncbi:MAG: YraN family protein [Thermomicrobiales bacterium]